VRNKAQKWVFEALRAIEGRLPFALLGLDSDNGSKFINSHLVRYCDERQISFTRSRPYRKNDNCYVEQKNWTVVRRTVGWARYDTSEELATLNRLYELLRLYVNRFQPQVKLIAKERSGARARKHYDPAATPYRRLRALGALTPAMAQRLEKEYLGLNPAALRRQITHLQRRLMELASLKEETRRKEVQAGACP